MSESVFSIDTHHEELASPGHHATASSGTGGVATASPTASCAKRISALEGENRRLRRSARDLREAERALRERVKELNCLYGISQLVEQWRDDLPALFQGIAQLLPPSWQYPEICCARIIVDDEEYRSEGFRVSPWLQSAEIEADGQICGMVEVYYGRKCAESSEGPFLAEERALINAVAESIGKVLERRNTETQLQQAMKQLQVEQTSLREANAALRGVLSRIEDEKKAVQNAIMANVEKVLMPVLHALETELPMRQRKYVSLLKQNLEEITSPFADRLSRAFTTLTSVEIRIANMIRDGLTTKEIAQLRHVSPSTVARQRERIRKKLGITGSDVNLATYLRTFLPESTE